MAVPAIRTESLGKRYGRVLALDSLSLQVEQGEIFGFLGPNGAGKSTAIRLLLDLIRPTTGRAEILGFDCQRQSRQVRDLCGYLPGELRLYPGLRGHETVELFASMRLRPTDMAFVHDVANNLDLDLDKHTGTYSKGNRQKLGVLIALLGDPRVLLWDEPTSGLDPIMQRTVWDILRRMTARGVTVFFSSHVMSEVEQICERVGILREGRLVTVQPVSELKARGLRHVVVSFADTAPPPSAFTLRNVKEIGRSRVEVEFEVTGEMDGLLKALANYHVADLKTEQPTLDEILLAYYEGVAV
ncbi:MAG: ABC transporter ATP-binding protein [Dehalococcoidia bacterium]|nr:ABC transporter ATP-binding protein [Dehalococcoidia bacterium]